jgi:hypothetical protein
MNMRWSDQLPNAVHALWATCAEEARNEGSMPAEAVQQLIGNTKSLLRSYGWCDHMIRQQLLVILSNLTIGHNFYGDAIAPTDRLIAELLELEIGSNTI